MGQSKWETSEQNRIPIRFHASAFRNFSVAHLYPTTQSCLVVPSRAKPYPHDPEGRFPIGLSHSQLILCNLCPATSVAPNRTSCRGTSRQPEPISNRVTVS